MRAGRCSSGPRQGLESGVYNDEEPKDDKS
jgi:hypothetical protein